jgi:hypothetical protein
MHRTYKLSPAQRSIIARAVARANARRHEKPASFHAWEAIEAWTLDQIAPFYGPGEAPRTLTRSEIVEVSTALSTIGGGK